jgi:hypothetical protein
MGGDQGVMNYVVLQKEAFDGLTIERRTIMRWPGHSMDRLDVASVAAGTAPPLVVHWAGMKATLLRDMVGGDLLQFFEDDYYRQMPFGPVRRRLALWRHVWIQWSFALGRRVRLRIGMWIKPRASRRAPDLVKRAIAS